MEDSLIGFDHGLATTERGGAMGSPNNLRDDRFLQDLAAGDARAASRLIVQIKEDRQRGGSEGLVALSAAFRSRIVAFQKKILNGNSEAALEAWNDTLIDIWERIDTYDSRLSKFRTWVYNAARYQALARKRRLIRDQRIPVIDLGAKADIIASAFELPDPLTTAEAGALNRAFQRLKPTQRQLLWFRFVEGWMPQEIVDKELVDGVGPKNVRVYINRSASRLKDLLAEELHGD